MIMERVQNLGVLDLKTEGRYTKIARNRKGSHFLFEKWETLGHVAAAG